MRNSIAALVAVSLTAASCGVASDPGGDDGSASSGSVPPSHAGGVELPAGEDLPETDLATHIVPLDDVIFNTFEADLDGRVRQMPLSRATPDAIERLRDAIPPIARPRYVSAEDATIPASDDDLVLGLEAPNGQAYAYPIGILNRHEIVNEELAGFPVLITYCPLCRSGVVYDRRLGGRELTFGNTSALYDNDLVMYDHQTNSYWWQIAGRAIVGTLSGDELEAWPSTMMPWSQWREHHPSTLVLSTETGFDRSYGGDGLGRYRDAVNAGRLPFPSAGPGVDDDRLEAGEEILGVVIGDEARAYPLRLMGDAVVNDEVADQELVVFVAGAGPSARVFGRGIGERVLRFELDARGILDLETGSRWTSSGRAVEGPLAGTRLQELPSRTSFWFAFASAFPDVEVVLSDS